MDNPEIILNLWYVYDDLGTIYSLRGRCYIGSGNDEEKLALLRRFAPTDYLIAQPFPVPERLHTTFVTEEGTRKLPVIGTGPVERMGGPEVLFEEVFVELEKQLPAQTRLSIGRDPLICITPLLGSEDGNLSPVTSPSGVLRSRRNPVAHEDSPDLDVPERNDYERHTADRYQGNDCTRNLPRPDLIGAAMSAQGGQIPLEEDTTFRLLPNAGDYLLCIRCTDPSCHPPKFDIIDFWEFHEGDRLLITNREEDYPAAAEQMEEGGPSLWKVVPPDRLAWVGWRGHSNERKPTLVALVNCLQEGYVYGEPASPTLESVMSFGTPTSEATSETRSLWMVGYDAAMSLGLPRNWPAPGMSEPAEEEETEIETEEENEDDDQDEFLITPSSRALIDGAVWLVGRLLIHPACTREKRGHDRVDSGTHRRFSFLIRPDLPEQDFWGTSRLAGGEPPVQSSFRFHITSGCP